MVFLAFFCGFLTAKLIFDKEEKESSELPRETPPLVRWMNRPVGSKPITYEDWKKENGIKD